ncbi:uncharacterized protein LOC124290432 [Haliotis rubra]|uniref:uncharacterized protein LOC124290432 n=1 Tax=Haliotis rubra TaxID=36100 RepID=UPI001EE52BDF|nr:uncharacterized protein LOC124290432 [Haliotis rubra]
METGPLTNTPDVTECIQSPSKSTLGGPVAGSAAGTQSVIEGNQPKDIHSTLSPTQDGAVIEGSQEQGRQPNPSVMEENQRQGLQSISTTTHNYIGCSVSQYDLSNSSHTSLGNPEHRGCVSQASLSIRIKQLNEVFEEIRTLHTAEEPLKKHNHVALCGAPGDGKTSIALKICEKYLLKKYEVVFVENIEEFQVDTIIQRQCDMLIVFDDMFGSVAFPSYLQKIKKVLTALADDIVNISVQKEQQDKRKRELKKLNVDKKNETLGDDDSKASTNSKVSSLSRTYNWNEGM